MRFLVMALYKRMKAEYEAGANLLKALAMPKIPIKRR